jgi:sigma-B regulation protein RsbU (phosphoserine phosphatase)
VRTETKDIMDSKDKRIEDLQTLNLISETLNRSADVNSALNSALAHLVDLMNLETGWITLIDPTTDVLPGGTSFVLAAHHNLPPALSPVRSEVWNPVCDCQRMCMEGRLEMAFNEIQCSRLAVAEGDRRGLTIHASSPLRSGNRILGILNVAARNRSSFDDRALTLLTNVGNQMGVALERARLYDIVRSKRINEQSALLSFTNQLLAYRDIEELMDVLVREVSRLLQIDACSLMLSDDDSQTLRFRASVGWEQDPVKASRTIPKDSKTSFGSVILTQKPVLFDELQDADPIDRSQNWLRTEGFRSHAVLPLVVEGRSIGALVINHRKPLSITEDEVRFLQVIANQAAIALESMRLHQEELKQQQLNEELAIGQKIQRSLLPESCPVFPGWEIAAIYQPAREVGGDLYDFFQQPDHPHCLNMVIADVTGKGIPAAFFMACLQTVIRNETMKGHNPSEILRQANLYIKRNLHYRLFAGAFYATLDTTNGHLTYANSGHNWPIWLQAETGEVEWLMAHDAVLGAFIDLKLKETTIKIKPNDAIVFYTDGITEARNSFGELYGEERLKAVVKSGMDQTAQQLMESIMGDIRTFLSGTPLSDDLTLFVIKRRGNQNKT